MKSAWVHASGMSFLHRSEHHSDGLNHLSCAYQNVYDQGWIEIWMLLPFSLFQNWHGRLLSVDYFWKVLLLSRLPPQFTCAQTYHMYPYRTFLKNIIPLCRIISPTSWGCREVESRSIRQGPFFWRRLIQVKAEGSYSVPLVIQRIYWTGYLKVFALRVSLRVFAC